jgi:ergothioneine biosynthesis protein EgtB
VADRLAGQLAEEDEMRTGPRRHAAAAAALGDAYARVRAATLALAAPLSAEDCQVQSMPEASPAKWHLAHVTWFFETFALERFEPGFRPFDPRFRVLFNSYYVSVGERHPRPQRGLIADPALETVRRYRAAVDERMRALLAQRGDDTAIADIVTLGLHHEQQHQELLLTDIKHAFSLDPQRAPYAQRWPIAAIRPQPIGWFGHAGGLVECGYDAGVDGTFCFDNETPRHRVFLRPFELASRPVTNGEFAAFIADGGYRRPELWLALGWDWVEAGSHRAPLYWHGDAAQGWSQFTLQGLVETDPHTPVCHLSYFEADAYARWADARLPTEAEWECAARALGPPLRGNFADSRAYHPLPQPGAARGEPVQMFGDVWEWTQSSYSPYPGYRPAPGAVGEYNSKFMCNQYVLRGGSCATPAGHVRASYRNFFAPAAQWQFSGVRLARDA